MKNGGRWVPLGAMGVFAALFLVLGREMRLSELLSWTPESPALAGLFLMGLYGLKGLSLVFPLLLLRRKLPVGREGWGGRRLINGTHDNNEDNANHKQ